MAKDTWIPSWLRGNEEVEDKDADAKKKLQETVEAAAKAAVSPIEERLKGLDSLVAFASEYKADKEKAANEASEAARKKKEIEDRKTETTDEDLAAMLLTDPRRALAEALKPQNQLIFTMRADQVKDRVFKDRADEFPYYSGDIRTEVDKILGEQDLKFRNDENAVANVYYTVVGRRQKEINEGKIKSRFAFSTSTTNGSSKTDEALTFDITPEIIRAAKLSGMDIDDYQKLLQKAAKAGEIEYV